MRACAVWLHHQHTAEENLLDRTGAVRKDDESSALCSSAAAAVAVGHPAESYYSLVALQAFASRNVTFEGASRGPRKKFSRLAIARRIFRPPHKLWYNSTTAAL